LGCVLELEEEAIGASLGVSSLVDMARKRLAPTFAGGAAGAFTWLF